jgi:hypothetical protein
LSNSNITPVVPTVSHTGNKYHRQIYGLKQYGQDRQSVTVDIYSVLTAYAVTSPGLQHAAKKILCCGIRGKGDRLQDLREARDALSRAIEDMERESEVSHADGKLSKQELGIYFDQLTKLKIAYAGDDRLGREEMIRNLTEILDRVYSIGGVFSLARLAGMDGIMVMDDASAEGIRREILKSIESG